MVECLALGEGLSVAAIGAEAWQTESKWRGWRLLSEDDRYEFQRAPAARYLIREHDGGDIFAEDRGPWFRGARRLVIVFRSGHQMRCGETPGWHALRRAIWDADDALAACPALGAGGSSANASARRAYWLVSPIISGFVYVAAPGGMSLCHWGVRIHDDFDPAEMSVESRHTIGLYQRLIDKMRRFDRGRMACFPEILQFPKRLVASRPRRRRQRAA